MKPDVTAAVHRGSADDARRSRDETAWSLLIVALVVLLIWSGWRSRAPEGTATVDPKPAAESPTSPESDPAINAPAEPDPVERHAEIARDIPQTEPSYYAPPIHVPFKHLYSLYDLPSRGWIRRPLITPEWLESFEHFCRNIARRDPADCAVQRILLLRLGGAPDGVLDPWIIQMQERLGAELEKGLGGVDLHAFQVTCSSGGCLLFLATGPDADWLALNENLVEVFTNDSWSPMLSLRQAEPLGGLYPDGTGQWEVFGFERLGPIDSVP